MDDLRARLDALDHHPRPLTRPLCGWRSLVCTMLACSLFGLLGRARPTHGAEFSCTAGDVACLITAINAANANGEENVITLAAGTYTLTTVDNAPSDIGPNGLPSITSILTVRGAGGQSTIIERATRGQRFRLLHVAPTGTLVLEGLTLRGGYIVSSDPPTWYGGGILNDGGRVTLSHSSLTGNIVVGNVSAAGGGLYNHGGTVILQSSTLASNSLEAMNPSGGGLYNHGGTVILDSSTLIGNSINSFTASGGGLATNGGTVTITDSTIAGNALHGKGLTGGGVAEIWPGGGLVEIVNSTIAGNTANAATDGRGGGLATAQGQWTITNSTIAGNQCGAAYAVGCGIAAGGPVSLRNAIVALNGSSAGTVTGPDCAGPVTSGDYNLIGDPTGCTMTLQPHDLTGDPGFAAYTDDGTPGHGYFPLLPTSPAVDAGNDAVCPPADQLGQSRVGRCDIGAVEYQPEQVTIRRAVFVNSLAHLLVSATSTAAPAAELFVTVPGCLADTPMLHLGDGYVLWRDVAACGNLDGQQATVTSTHGGSASAPLR